MVKPFFVQHYVRLYNASALTERYALSVFYVIYAVKFAAPYTMVPVYRAVKLKNVFTAGFLVEAVYVLRNNGQKPAFPFKFRKLYMRGVRLCVEVEHFVAVKVKKALSVFFKKAVAEHYFRRVIVLLVVKPVHAPKVGDAAFC